MYVYISSRVGSSDDAKEEVDLEDLETTWKTSKPRVQQNQPWPSHIYTYIECIIALLHVPAMFVGVSVSVFGVQGPPLHHIFYFIYRCHKRAHNWYNFMYNINRKLFRQMRYR